MNVPKIKSAYLKAGLSIKKSQLTSDFIDIPASVLLSYCFIIGALLSLKSLLSALLNCFKLVCWPFGIPSASGDL